MTTGNGVLSPRTIGVLVESSRAYGRGLLRGIARYAQTRKDWSLLYQEWNLGDPTPDWLIDGNCDGILARIETVEIMRSIQRLKIPTVDLRQLHRSAGIPSVVSDNHRIAELGAEHLLEKGFRHIGYCGFSGLEYSTARRDFFFQYLRDRGLAPHSYDDADARQRNLSTPRREIDAMLHEKGLSTWLRSLPKPVGIMACNDVRGRHVLSACRALGIAVPDEVAVVGVDDDEILCELSNPPLSSVIPATERIGLEAASLLDAMLSGAAVPVEDVVIAPLGVTVRLSSDVVAVEDHAVATSLRFIRQHACEGINVSDVLEHLSTHESTIAVSRSTLDRRFAELLRRSCKDEILRVRMEHVRALLLDTDFTLAEIAAKVGLSHAEQLHVQFKRAMGETPGAYRARLGNGFPRPAH